MGSVFRFKIGPYPVHVTGSALFIVALIVLMQAGDGSNAQLLLSGVLWALALFGSILVHELGHAVVGGWLGLKPYGIVLHGFGGLTRYGRAPAPKHGVIASIAGPMAGFSLAAIAVVANFLVGAALPPLVRDFVVDLIWVNGFWSAFNLLPMRPLDGGHALTYLLALILPPLQAFAIVRALSIGLAVVVAIAGWYLHLPFIAIISAFVLMNNFGGRRPPADWPPAHADSHPPRIRE